MSTLSQFARPSLRRPTAQNALSQPAAAAVAGRAAALQLRQRASPPRIAGRDQRGNYESASTHLPAAAGWVAGALLAALESPAAALPPVWAVPRPVPVLPALQAHAADEMIEPNITFQSSHVSSLSLTLQCWNMCPTPCRGRPALSPQHVLPL